ncbi:hypothetical protein AF332_15990 [Sporosarcina globispora]|uniref:Uncharacterized protein n=1 Tax=Sporosarcina globispora TaxID=1459 RepID=A0A0M0GF88_SPOGL|nr:hypothetical protein AF332_15990 [Sporosarcina globispora]
MLVEKSKRASRKRTLIRTWKREISVSVSEVRALSDRKRRKPQERVRTQSSFGHKNGKSQYPCPKSVLFRTEKEENQRNVSEPRAHSDTKTGNLSERVRSSCSFGQKKKKTEETCPNPELIRTQKRETSVNQSEVRPLSDIKRRKPKERARTQSSFGLGNEKPQCASPKVMLFRTEKEVNRRKMSEPRAHLDTKTGNLSERVRSSCSFGQKKKNTQNRLRTPYSFIKRPSPWKASTSGIELSHLLSKTPIMRK